MNSRDRLRLDRFRAQCSNDKRKREAGKTTSQPSNRGKPTHYGQIPTDKPFVINNPTNDGQPRAGDRTPYEQQLDQYNKDLSTWKALHPGNDGIGNDNRFGGYNPSNHTIDGPFVDATLPPTATPSFGIQPTLTPFGAYQTPGPSVYAKLPTVQVMPTLLSTNNNAPKPPSALLAFNNPTNIGKTLQGMFPSPTPVPSTSFLGVPTPPPDTPVTQVPNPTPQNDPNPPGPTPPPPPPPPPLPSHCPSYHPDHSTPATPSQSDTVKTITAYVNAKGYHHDPNGIPWISAGSWVPWDGVTTINPCTSTTAQIEAFIFPKPGGVNCMRGLRELFYKVNPYADNANPTVAEIENWNIEVIRLFRRLLGFDEATHPVSNDKCTYLKAAWATERLHTNYWTAGYPGTQDSATGPCTQPSSSNAHCGASFIPNPTDQTPYLCPSNMAPCTNTLAAEGISNHNTDIPWSIKMSRIIGSYLHSDGIGGHTGPFVGRPLFGSAWYIDPTKPGTMEVRTKWGGPLAPTC